MRTTMLLIFTIILAAMTIFSQTMPPIEAGVSQSLAKWRAANYSDVRYKLNLTLEKMSPTLKGTIEISLKNNADRIVLDWRKIRGKEGLSTVSNVSINGKAAVSSSDFSRLSSGNAKPTEVKTQNFYEFNEHLVFKDGVIKGENVIRLDFTSPIATSGAAITRYVDKEDGAEYVYSLFVPSDASTAFPVFDQPDLKAKFKLTVTAPKDWKVVTNTDFYNHFDLEGVSRFVSVQGDSATSAFWEAAPISTYVFAFAAGNFEVFSESEFLKTKQLTTFSSPRRKMHHDKAKDVWTEDEEGIEIYVRKSQAEKFKQHAAEVFRLNREGVKFLESYFDYKFPFPKYDLVLIPEFPFGGMEHAGATFLREDRVIFPTEPTKNDYITRANVILHEAAHQWFGDTVTMKWFDDLWLKEGFAEFMAYKTLAQVMPEYNAWKIFYERNKQLAYLTDATKGTTPIYQEIPNLSAAKSAYGNIVYRKAPSFLRQAEFYLGEDKFQAAVRAFLKKHEFANAEWTDLVKEFEAVSGGRQKEDFTTLTKVSEKRDLSNWAKSWVTRRGMPIVKFSEIREYEEGEYPIDGIKSLRLEVKRDWYKLQGYEIKQKNILNEGGSWLMSSKILIIDESGKRRIGFVKFTGDNEVDGVYSEGIGTLAKWQFAFPNYQDYGYGIFLLDERSRAYVLENIQTEKDDFLRAMMWGSLWDSVRESELNPKDYVELVIKNINVESDESTIQTLLNRVSVAMIYYLSELPTSVRETLATDGARETGKPRTDVGGSDLCERLETLLIDKMQNAPTLGMRITFYRAFLNIASSEKARIILKQIYMGDFGFGGGDTKTRAGVKKVDGKMIYAANPAIPIKTKDRLDIVTKLLILGDAAAPKMLAELEKTETSDEAKRYAYAAKAGIGTTENKAGFWNDFTNNKEISESYLESSLGAFNSPKQADLTLPYLEKALRELPNLKRSRKIFFVNGWLAAFIGGQKSEQALAIVSKFLADNPNLDKDLRLKILENADGLERAVKIRAKFSEH